MNAAHLVRKPIFASSTTLRNWNIEFNAVEKCLWSVIVQIAHVISMRTHISYNYDILCSKLDAWATTQNRTHSYSNERNYFYCSPLSCMRRSILQLLLVSVWLRVPIAEKRLLNWKQQWRHRHAAPKHTAEIPERNLFLAITFDPNNNDI